MTSPRAKLHPEPHRAIRQYSHRRPCSARVDVCRVRCTCDAGSSEQKMLDVSISSWRREDDMIISWPGGEGSAVRAGETRIVRPGQTWHRLLQVLPHHPRPSPLPRLVYLLPCRRPLLSRDVPPSALRSPCAGPSQAQDPEAPVPRHGQPSPGHRSPLKSDHYAPAAPPPRRGPPELLAALTRCTPRR
jgi:hypothetical protein